jgi:tetratricopeptide (TPR) repeat protein
MDLCRAISIGCVLSLLGGVIPGALFGADSYKGSRPKPSIDHTIEKDTERINRDPKNPVAYLTRGLTYYYLARYDKAIDDFSKAVGLEPKFGAAYMDRAICYRYLRQYDLALRDYDMAIKLEPKVSDNYNNRGLCYLFMGRYEDVIKDMGRAIELDPKNLGSYLHRAAAYSALKETAKANADYRKAASFDAETPEEFNNRGLAKYFLGRYQDCIKDLNQAIRMNPLYIAAYQCRADCYLKMGDVARSEQDEQTAERLIKHLQK